jgi:DNA-binding XRE family transcriptional regulator
MTGDILDAFYKELGVRVKELRERVGMKQEVLADSLGLTRASVINIEKGRHKPNLHTIIHISMLLNDSYESLIPDNLLRKAEPKKLDFKDFENVVTDQKLDKQTMAVIKKAFANLNK